MKWKKRKQEQLNSVAPPEPELEETFTLEDILREFGTHPPPPKVSDPPSPPPPATTVTESTTLSATEPENQEAPPKPIRESPRQMPLPPRPQVPPEAEPDEIDLLLASAPKPKPLRSKPVPEPQVQSAPRHKKRSATESPAETPDDSSSTVSPAPPAAKPSRAVPKVPKAQPKKSVAQTPPKKTPPPVPKSDKTSLAAFSESERLDVPDQYADVSNSRDASAPKVVMRKKQARPAPPPPPPPSPEQLRRKCMQKLGTSRLRLVLCMLLTLSLIGLSIYQEYQLSWFPILGSIRTMATVSIFLWAICVLLTYDVLIRGFEQLFRLHIGLETLTSISTILIAIDAVGALRQEQMPYCTVGALGLCFALWGLSDSYLGHLHTLRVVAQAAEDPKAVREVPAAWNDRSGLFRSRGDTEQFMRQLEQPDLTSCAMRFYAPTALVISFGIALYLSATGKSSFVQAWMILLLGATPLCGFLSYSRPFSLLARRLAKSGGAICGWAGVKIFSGRHILLLHDDDVFPIANISLNGVKLYGGYPIGRVISYAAAVTSACGSTLAPIFEEYRVQQSCRHSPVRMYRYYEVGGVGAEIFDDVVLMGSLRFMNSMGVHMDAGMKVKQAVYLSINGELACVFAMKYKPSPSTGSGLRAIVRNGHFDTVLATRDFLTTPEYLRYKYDIPADKFIYPAVKERLRLSEQDLTCQGEQGALLLKDSFSAFAYTVCGGCTLRSCVQIGTAVDLVAGIAGLVLMALLLWLDAIATASVLNLTLFLLGWALPGLLLSRWTHRA